MILGGTYRIPILMKLLDKNFIKDLKMDGGPSVSAVKKLYLCIAGVYIFQKNCIYANGEA